MFINLRRAGLIASLDKKTKEIELNNFIYKKNNESKYVMSLTDMCAQCNWNVPSFFPCCPKKINENPLEEYFENMQIGSIFSYNDHYPESKILESIMINNNSSILVMCQREGIKPWTVAEIKFENSLFVHSNLGSYFDKNGADKLFCIMQGLEWVGPEPFDDYC